MSDVSERTTHRTQTADGYLELAKLAMELGTNPKPMLDEFARATEEWLDEEVGPFGDGVPWHVCCWPVDSMLPAIRAAIEVHGLEGVVTLDKNEKGQNVMHCWNRHMSLSDFWRTVELHRT